MGQLETLRNGKRKAVLEALRLGNTRRAACRAARIDPSTLYQWMRDDPALSDDVLCAEAEAEKTMLGSIHAAATGAGVDQDWRAAAFWAERRLPEFSPRATMTVMQRMLRDIDGMTDEQLDELEANATRSSGAGAGAFSSVEEAPEG